ncbi:hypothetical protein wVul_1160 [Wolbachia endosymbiont of Armadillidium vulgare str. wVulC]|nr:hypothetical protein wVul_1160 [Wolbachia endosymbiont of Armadillidium vulgare str. wVulC]OJH31587.1 hypothetical protein Wxf_00981 [Wolbachia endosymbiont of Armadillidium vulgare]OJH32191.1 hypothetical protein Wxf_01616 [Wolbachia endosymbiont of Armadillidium vulgare]OJH33012.1 hypothetical protein Wxf_02478 [Wolbachia endosymbiont of Armadillidium vulgare]
MTTKQTPKNMRMDAIINYQNNINLISAIVDIKLMLAYSSAISIKKKLLRMIDIAVMSKTTCVEKLLNAKILLYTSLDLNTIQHNITLIQDKSA